MAQAGEAKFTMSQRLLALGEVLLGSFLVIGHNVFHVLPNEVPLLFLLFWFSFRLRTGRWKATEFALPQLWWKIILWAISAAAVLVLGSEYVIEPISKHIWPGPERVSSLLRASAMGWEVAFRNLMIIWTFAAFGEETGYRGYLLGRTADLFNRSRTGDVIALFYTSVLFGFGHYYKGPAGVVDSTYSGLVLGSAYLLSGRNLWIPMLAHGIVDTYAILLLWTGLAT